MARLGDDVYQWNVEQLVNWLRSEGLNDCVATFTLKKIDGCKLLNLNDVDIKNLHVSHESKKKLIKVVEKFKRRKKGNIDRMFGDKVQVQRVNARTPGSFSHDDEDSDDGWGTDEWEESSGEEHESSGDGGEYLEPEDDFSNPTGSPFKKEAPALFQTGLVAQLREGIAQSLKRTAAPHHEQQYEDEDIYDEPPQEEEFETEDVYEEPSDSSGGAVVVRPPPKPPRIENGPAYLTTRGEEPQDTYEAPIEGEDISQSPTNKQRFIPTKVQPQGRGFGQQDMNCNDMETYDVPEFSDAEYEIPDTKKSSTAEVPPPRPPKKLGAPASTPSPTPARPPKQQPSPISSSQPKKTVYRKPSPSNQAPQESPNSRGNSFPQQQMAPQPQTSRYPQRQGGNLPSPGGTTQSPGHLANKPTLPSKQGSPVRTNASADPAHRPKQTFTPHGSAFQGIPTPKPSQLYPKPTTPAKPRPSLPTEERRPPPKARPKLPDPMQREPAPQPGTETIGKLSGPRAGLPDSPTRREPTPRKVSDPPVPRKVSDPPVPRKVSDPPVPRKVSDPPLPRKVSGPPSPHIVIEKRHEVQKPPLPVPTLDTGRTSPRPSTLPVGRDQPPALPPHSPKKGSSGPQQRRSGPLPVAPGHDRPPELPPSEPAAPPRPPKKGTPQPELPPQRPGGKRGVPLPNRPTASHQSARDAREQSSGSSLESGSADEPVVPLPSPNRPPGGHRNLPQTPTERSWLDMMREAPWFHGSVDRKKSEANLKLVNMDGAFLVRNSTKNPNDYSMSLLHKEKICHLQIPNKDGQYVLGASGIQRFDTIMDLVAYYRQNEVDLVKGGKTKLTVHAQNIHR